MENKNNQKDPNKVVFKKPTIKKAEQTEAPTIEKPVDAPEKVKDKAKIAKNKAILKYSLMGTASAAAIAGIVAGALIISKPENYTLTYIIDGKVVEVSVLEDTLLSSIPAPSVTGYSFDGWYLDPTYTTKLTEGYSFEGDVELYPKFSPKKFQVTFDANNGIGGFVTQEVYFNSEYTVVENIFLRNNYSFVGWSTDSTTRYDSSDLIQPNDVYTLETEGLTLYAVWRGVDRQITIDNTDLLVNGTAYNIPSVTIPHGDYYTLPNIVGTVSNASDNTVKFGGYNIGGDIYQAGSKVLITADTSITINWQVANSVLNFNIQAPSGETIPGISPMMFYTDSENYTYTNLPNPATATNYEFVGWNTSPDGTGKTYNVGDTFETSQTTAVLYAIWQGKERTIILYKNSSVVETITCRYGDTITLPTYELDKYTFLGFNNSSNYTGTTYRGNVSVLFPDSEVSLYAEYSRNQITVSFNSNGGVGTIDNMVINSEETYIMSNAEIASQRAAITRQYYTLIGWSTDASATSASFNIEAGESSLPLYAIWARNQVQVTYSSNMDSMLPISHKIDQGSTYTFSEDGFVKDGYYIVEFKVGDNTYKAGDTIPCVEGSAMRVEAVWKKIEKVLFKNAGAVSVVETTAGENIHIDNLSSGTTIYAPYVAVENSYKTNANGDRVYFAGWATTENATKPTVFAKSTQLTITDSQQIFYAVYMEASLGLEYVYNATHDNYSVSLSDAILDITDTDYTLVIPNIYNGKPVVSFENTEYFTNKILWWSDQWVETPLPIKHAVIAEGVTKLDSYALGYSTHLTDVTLPSGLTHIGEGVFSFVNISSIKIPETVTTIGYSGFSGCKNLESIELPAGLQELGNYAFCDTGLRSVKIPHGVTNLKSAFSSCYNLTSAEIPSSVTSMDRAFSSCSSLSNVKLASGLTAIGAYAFFYCENLESIDIPETVTMIGNSAFCGCASLSSIELPSTITEIGEETFSGCTNLKSIDIPDTVTTIGEDAFWSAGIESLVLSDTIESIGYYAFSNCKSLTNITINNGIVTKYSDDFTYCPITTVTYGEGVTSIPFNAWKDCATLQTVNLPSTLTMIEGFAFSNCTNLKNIDIPATVTTIGENAFGDTGIETLVLPNTISDIGDYAFSGSEISSINIPTSQTTIGLCWFYGCNNLKSIVIPDTITYIGEGAFGCTGLESITIPSSVTGIYPHAFHGCKSLKSVTINTNYAITYDARLSPFTTSNGNQPENNCPIETVTYGEGVTSIPDNAWKDCTTLKAVNFPSTVTSIGSSAFANCNELTSVTIPEGVTEIKDYTFDGCMSLSSVSLPENLTSIGMLAFGANGITSITLPSTLRSIGAQAFNSSYLTSIVIPEGVTSIGASAFGYLSNLTSAVIPSTVTTIGVGVFENCGSLQTVTINTNAITTYADYFTECPITTVTYGAGVTAIPAEAWANCSTLQTVNLPNSIETIGDGAFSYTGVSSIELPDTITEIGAGTFLQCTNLETIVIPSSVTKIGTVAFENSGLRSITIPSAVATVGDMAFVGCSHLTEVVINTNAVITYSNHFKTSPVETVTYGAGVTAIPAMAWQNATTLTTINLPSGLVSIGASSFESTGITEIIIPNTVKNIYARAFYGCNSIKSVAIPSSVKTIGDTAFGSCGLETVTFENGVEVTSIENVFAKCESLTSITIPSHVTNITGAFDGCTALSSVTLPSSLIEIGQWAFCDCTNLKNITIPSTVTTIAPGAFSNSGIETLVLPDTINNVGQDAFGGSAISSINIPTSLTTIPCGMFRNCKNLKNITIPEGVRQIEDSAFEASGLENITIPSSVTWIYYGAFESCESLTNVTINTNAAVTYAKNFSGCPIEYITFGSSVTEIPEEAWAGISSLSHVQFSEGLESIGPRAFADSDIFEVSLPSTLETIGYCAFETYNPIQRIDIFVNTSVDLYEDEYETYGRVFTCNEDTEIYMYGTTSDKKLTIDIFSQNILDGEEVVRGIIFEDINDVEYFDQFADYTRNLVQLS